MADESRKDEKEEYHKDEKEQKKTALEDAKLFPIATKEKDNDASKKEMSKAMERNVVVLFAFIGAIVGYASFLVVDSLVSFAVAVIIYIVAQTILKSSLKIKTGKILSGNGFVVYFMMWLIVWTIFYNMQLLASY